MPCVSPSAESWRLNMPEWDDEHVEKELKRAWVEGEVRIKNNAGRTRIYHDWTCFRAATIREARKRGLDLPVTYLGT